MSNDQTQTQGEDPTKAAGRHPTATGPIQRIGDRLASLVPKDGWSWRTWTASLLALAVVPATWITQLLVGRDKRCPNLDVASSFSSDPRRFVDYVTSSPIGQPKDDARCRLTNLDAFHGQLLLGIFFAVLSAVILMSLWAIWWRRAWLTKVFVASSPVVWLAPVGAVCQITQHIIQWASIDLYELPARRGIPRIGWFASKVLPVFAWIKVLAFSTVFLAIFCTLMAALSRRHLVDEPSPGQPRPPMKPDGLGICCSGGGIRAASISIGALGVLERTQPDGTPILKPTGTQGILDHADYLASVSGGGYAAGAWRIARGIDENPDQAQFAELWPSGIIGTPDNYTNVPPSAFDSPHNTGEASLFRHLQQRREYLRTGRGGFGASMITALTFLVIQLLLLLGLLVAVAWPIGRLARTSYVYGGIGCRLSSIETPTGTVRAADLTILDLTKDGDLPAALCTANDVNKPGTAAGEDTSLTKGDALMRYSPTRTRVFLKQPGLQLPIRWRLYGPAAMFATLALLLYLISLFQWNSDGRAKVRRAAQGLAAAGVFSGVLLVGVPVWLDVGFPWLVHHSNVRAIAGLVSGGGVVAVVVGLVRKVLGPKLVLLGGVFLAIGALLLGTFIAGEAAVGEDFFGKQFITRDWLGWAGLCAVLGIGYFVLCPRWWSLHTLYRNRLRGAFATTRTDTAAPKRLRAKKSEEFGTIWPIKQRNEPQLAAYAKARGPVHLICCSVARQHRTSTGVKALSMVLSPHEVVFYDVDAHDPHQPVTVSLHGKGLPVKAYSVPTTPWLRCLGSKWSRQSEGTVSAGISVSGAAVAPAMGRMDKGSTMALFAALNLRLGSWYPNPRYVRPHADESTPYPRVRLSYMLKELAGYFDLSDHHLYATDGGHRENLGLVELLRRRCKTMICIDSSGDTPGSYTTLRQAVDLARVEVGAVINLDPLRAKRTTFKRHLDADPARDVAFGASIAGDFFVNPSRMSDVGNSRPPSAHTVFDVTYYDTDGNREGAGTIIHIAAVLYDGLPEELVAFSLQDANYPHYSTGNQFLTEEQYRRLVQFGQEATKHALADPKVIKALIVATH